MAGSKTQLPYTTVTPLNRSKSSGKTDLHLDKKEEQLHSLKALDISTFKQQISNSEPRVDRIVHNECMAASNPPETPTPTWPKGRKTSGRAGRTARQHTLLTRQRRVSPTAMGRKPATTRFDQCTQRSTTN